MRADPRNFEVPAFDADNPEASKKRKSAPWLSHYGITPTTEAMWALWDLDAGVNTAKDKTPPKYPRPERGKTTHRG